MAVLNSPREINAELDPKDLPFPPQLPRDIAAIKLVLKDLNRAEYYLLAKGMTVEWDKDDRLYLFRMPQAFWEGSSTPRSSLGMPLALEHIESIMPQVMGALFADDPPFSVDPRPKTSMEAARAVKELLAYQMENMQFKEEMRIGIKECLNYGTAFWKWGWKRYTKQKATWKRKG